MVTTQVCEPRVWGVDLSGRRGSIAVIGLGHIGLPTAVVLAHHGWQVAGVDVRPQVVASVNAGRLPFLEAGMEEPLGRAVSAGRLEASHAIPRVGSYIISVPTPITEAREADLSAIDAVVEQLAQVLRGGETIILESTSPTGTTSRLAQMVHRLRPDLAIDGPSSCEWSGGLLPGQGGEGGHHAAVCFAYAPERVLPGRIVSELAANDRIVGGLTPEASFRAAGIYRSFSEGEVVCTTARTAELVKLSENAFRDVNIAFANELSLIAEREGVDVHEVIRLANRHPRVDILRPGPGVGGHCIAVDPWFIVQGNPEVSRLIRTAREVNDSKPGWVLEQLTREMARFAGAPMSPRVAILGLSFKPDVDDLRQSPALQIAREAATSFPHVRFLLLEPNISVLPEDLRGLENVELVVDARAVVGADVIVPLVAHRQFRHLRQLLRQDVAILDVTGMWCG